MQNELIETRKEYAALIKKELLGPGSEISCPDEEHEIISSSPEYRYSLGILFPQYNTINADSDDTVRSETSDDSEEAEELEDIALSESAEKPEQIAPDEEEKLDEDIGLAAQNMPSSAGFTFFARGNTDRIWAQISFAVYRAAKKDDCIYPLDSPVNIPEKAKGWISWDDAGKGLRLLSGGLKKKIVSDLFRNEGEDSPDAVVKNAMYRLSEQLEQGYVREPQICEVLLDFTASDYCDSNTNLCGKEAKVTALRRKISDGFYSVTIVLINTCTDKANGRNCLFQPEIRIKTADNSFVFSDYSAAADFSALDEEEKSLEMQYRNKKVYASGLGVSVNWDVAEDGRGEVFSDFFPSFEVPGMDFSMPEDANVLSRALSMKYLSDLDKADKSDKITELESVVEAYAAWIAKIKEKADAIHTKYSGKYDEPAQANILACTEAKERMLGGITILKTNEKAWTSFQLANRAMFMQRIHLNMQAKTAEPPRFPDDPEVSGLLDAIDYYSADDLLREKYHCTDKYLWRPFQLAFLLMSIRSITDDSCDERNLVDLIWFPTGGGKTEAYLGLTAFTIFYRRLMHSSQSGGTAVIMRYTLRLLAAQQFTRASTLICACEMIRQDSASRMPQYGKYDLGTAEISIGLWIGGEHTPNTVNEAKEKLLRLTKAAAAELRSAKDRHNKFQVLKCPWCGTKMVQERDGNKKQGCFGYALRNNRFELFCPTESCPFNSKLPVQVVDEELYKNPPTLLFGTVDKFAMLPWNNKTGAFFASFKADRAPELIIQDELHLISGPLGTMVGLYESVIDKLCSAKGVPSKIIASTATIRRAREQCSALYDREVRQFPPPGLDAEDSFFAREAPIDYENGKYGRLYVGLMSSGKTKAMMEDRTISALMQLISNMDLADETRDKYWTLTAYFNSLRDLGKCSTLVDDDVKEFIRILARRKGNSRRLIGNADELTSRVTTTTLNETLEKLEKITYSRDNKANKLHPSNILLATNMISVGIDIARLNVMLMVGQPKLTSEYIQASSRVGRAYPGVVFTMYEGSKSRDRSHYEQFIGYHSSFYKYVEPTGATPFSKPARDRALHAIVTAFLRNSAQELSAGDGAKNFSHEEYAALTDEIETFLMKRSQSITSRLDNGMEDDSLAIKEEIEYFLERWEAAASQFSEGNFSYGEKFMVKHPEASQGRLLKSFNSDPNDLYALDTMTSMRNVDGTVPGNVLIWED